MAFQWGEVGIDLEPTGCDQSVLAKRQFELVDRLLRPADHGVDPREPVADVWDEPLILCRQRQSQSAKVASPGGGREAFVG